MVQTHVPSVVCLVNQIGDQTRRNPIASLRLSIADEPFAPEVVDSDSISQEPPFVIRRLPFCESVHSATLP